MNTDLNHFEIETIDPLLAHIAREGRLHATCIHCGPSLETDEREELLEEVTGHRRRRLLDAFVLRHGADEPRFSSHLIIEQAADRFFELVSTVEDSLRGRFTEAEFDVLLNCECSPVWSWDRSMAVASMVAEDQRVGSLRDLVEGDPLRVLLEKLVALTPVENAALVDVCERVWRGHDNPLL